MARIMPKKGVGANVFYAGHSSSQLQSQPSPNFEDQESTQAQEKNTEDQLADHIPWVIFMFIQF